MRLLFPAFPAGWPGSLRCFALAAVLVVLLRLPGTGVPLSYLGAIAGTTLLITLGMVGIVAEVVMRRASVPWVIVPALYVAGFYALRAYEQRTIPRAAADIAASNANAALPFDPAPQDLLVDDRAATGIVAETMIAHFAIDRAFDHRGLLVQIGAPDACARLRENPEFESARIVTSPVFFSSTPVRSNRTYCVIRRPSQPTRPVVRASTSRRDQRYGLLSVDLREIEIRDEARNTGATVRSGNVGRLKLIPLDGSTPSIRSGRGVLSPVSCATARRRSSTRIRRSGLRLHCLGARSG
jgi:hypothetical protein